MNRRPAFAKTTLRLIAAVLVLPVAITVVLAVAALLTAMGDSTGGSVLRYIALGCGILWLVGLVCLVVVQALGSLRDKDETDE